MIARCSAGLRLPWARLPGLARPPYFLVICFRINVVAERDVALDPLQFVLGGVTLRDELSALFFVHPSSTLRAAEQILSGCHPSVPQ